jgi:predicted  nucleic acid-binding Zn ribbon protein
MFVWRDARGVIVADVIQVLRMDPVRRQPQVKYVARVSGDSIEKDRFSCASRAINEWLILNRISATPSPA